MNDKMFNELSMELAVSAREYFMILRLALYHVEGRFAETSSDVAEALRGDDHADTYKMACKILRALNKKGE